MLTTRSDTTKKKKKLGRAVHTRALLLFFTAQTLHTSSAQVQVCPQYTDWYYAQYDGGASTFLGYCDGTSTCPGVT